MSRFLSSLLAFAGLLSITATAFGQSTIFVDASNPSCPGSGTELDPFCLVQDGINAASSGDTVRVSPGTYLENLDFLGKAITVVSSQGPTVTTIDGMNNATVVTFQNGETLSSVLRGFTITHGSALAGAGIRCDSASPTITNNTIVNNQAFVVGPHAYYGYGGGVYLKSSSAELSSNLISGNRSGNRGGGVHSQDSSPVLIGNAISNNSAVRSGGGVTVEAGSALLLNNTITRNLAEGFRNLPYTAFPGRGGGLNCDGDASLVINNTIAYNTATGVQGPAYYYPGEGGGLWVRSSTVTVANTTLWSDSPDEIFGTPTVRFSDIQGGYSGTGNINSDPLFLNGAVDDYRLSCLSPCVDSGTDSPGATLPRFDQSGSDLRTIGTTDMGADELGTLWTLNGAPIVGGPPVHFTATATSGHPSPNLSLVLISLGDGSTSGGIPVPLSSGRRLMLDADGIFSFWLGLPSVLREVTSLNGCTGASTVPRAIPTSTPVGVTFYYAGVTWDLGVPVVTSISETHSVVTQ